MITFLSVIDIKSKKKLQGMMQVVINLTFIL